MKLSRTMSVVVVALTLPLFAILMGAGASPLFSQWPAPPADAIVPDANQQITVLWPLPGQRYTSTDHLHIEYRTGDGVPAELYVDGQHIPNDSEVALCRYALGTHKVRVNPLMHPEKAQEVSFQIVPVATLKDTPDTIEVALDMDPFSAAHLDAGSLKLVSVNGQTLAADQIIPASQPLSPACASTTSPWLRCVKTSFSKQKLQTQSKPLSVKNASVQGYVDLAPPNWSREMVAWAGKEGLDEEAKDRRADRGDIAGRGECRDA